MIKLEDTRTKVAAPPIDTPFFNEVVTARAEQQKEKRDAKAKEKEAKAKADKENQLLEEQAAEVPKK